MASLTRLVSPYVTITPIPPTHLSMVGENRHLRQRIPELEFSKGYMTNKSIDLDRELLRIKIEVIGPCENYIPTDAECFEV